MSDKNNYKHTLNLPSTTFPMKANLSVREMEFLNRWERENTHEKMMAYRKNAPLFILHDGPPYANGSIHIGHAVNKILKDIILKFKHLKGFKTPFVPGWDCHGLPIELNIEKKYGKVGQKITAQEFRAYCRKYADQQIQLQSKDFRRLGIFGDWEGCYQTKSFDVEANILRSLGKILESKHVHLGFKPISWCLNCASSLAEAEVEYHSKQSTAVDVAFPVLNSGSSAVLKKYNENVAVVIWTTTPWTLPANQAVAVAPNLKYSLLELSKPYEGFSRIWLSDCLVDIVLERYNYQGTYEKIATCTGEDLSGLHLQHPLENRSVPVVCADYVGTETGTGLVHIAPSCGLDDFYVGKKYKLSLDSYVNQHGVYLPCAGAFAGQHITKSQDNILQHLKQKGCLIDQQNYEHSYPHCWRHKTPIIFRLTHQWFIGLQKNDLVNQVLSNAKHVEWIPAWGEKSLINMVSDRPDWCISRQRYWGVPIAFFKHKTTGALHPDTAQFIENVAQAIEKKGIDAWFNDPMTFLPSEDHALYEAVTDVLDVWFDSGVTHASVVQKRFGESVIADLYLEGKDQYRGWFQSSLVTACAMGKEAPFKQVLTHGFVVDQTGRKMSKSLGNVISSQEVVEKLGADVLRLWVATTDYKQELTISDAILKQTGDSYRRIRNTFRFFLSNLSDFNPDNDCVEFSKMVAFDQWILDECRALMDAIDADYEKYQFYLGVKKIVIFCSEVLGGFYLDVVKDRLYTCKSSGLARRSAQTALFHMSQALLRYLMPILPFTTEEVLDHVSWKNDGVFQTDVYDLSFCVCPDHCKQQIQHLRLIKRSVDQLLDTKRKAGEIKQSLMAELYICLPDDALHALRTYCKELHFFFMVAAVHLQPLSSKSNQDIWLDVTDKICIQVNGTKKPQCMRCWFCDDGVSDSQEQLCARCTVNIESNEGETRSFF